jgi:hypothetical protein
LLDRKSAQEQAGKRASQERSDDGYRRVSPVGASFARDGKNRVRDTRTQVACRIDGVSGGAAERKANTPHQASHEIGARARSRTGRGNALRKDRADNEHEYEGGNDLT